MKENIKTSSLGSNCNFVQTGNSSTSVFGKTSCTYSGSDNYVNLVLYIDAQEINEFLTQRFLRRN